MVEETHQSTLHKGKKGMVMVQKQKEKKIAVQHSWARPNTYRQEPPQPKESGSSAVPLFCLCKVGGVIERDKQAIVIGN
jgi:hypothetical protein